MIVVLMGVTGTGKSTVAKGLQGRTGWIFAEGDDYHSEANKAKMHAGHPLTDADRAPWLATLHTLIAGWAKEGKDGILTCSALKQAYRDTLVGTLPAGTIRFVVLEAPRDVLVSRLGHRAGHFMNPDLLDSQLATLEDPKDALHVDVSGPAENAVEQILTGLAIKTSQTV